MGYKDADRRATSVSKHDRWSVRHGVSLVVYRKWMPTSLKLVSSLCNQCSGEKGSAGAVAVSERLCNLKNKPLALVPAWWVAAPFFLLRNRTSNSRPPTACVRVVLRIPPRGALA